MNKLVLAVALVLGSLCVVSDAKADPSFRIQIGGYPGYYAPPPSYYYQPRPYYYAPPSYYYRPPYYNPYHNHYNHSPHYHR